jgi:hypothetical protein
MFIGFLVSSFVKDIYRGSHARKELCVLIAVRSSVHWFAEGTIRTRIEQIRHMETGKDN